MNFEFKTFDLAGAAREKCDALIVLFSAVIKAEKDPISAFIAAALKAGDLVDKPGKLLITYRPSGMSATHLVIAGVGEGSPKDVRQVVSAAISAVKGKGAKKICLCFVNHPKEDVLASVIMAVADSSYVYVATKTKPEGREFQRVLLNVPGGLKLKPSFDHAVACVAGVEFAKEWANRPANHATPTHLAGAAKALAKFPGIKCEVLGPKEVASLGMGSFMAVSQGSEEPLRFIVLHYNGAPKTQTPTVLIGKGITFDSGGISIKPAGEMDEMKFDMCGAASVLGVFRSLAELKPSINVVGLIPSCENLINGRAVKPGDVVTSMSGQTIEILNTDAEGRFVLCDALTYAEGFNPRAVIDIATLTGACVVALGAVRSGLFSPDETLVAALLSAGESSSDLCWRMPLDDDYSEGLKSNFADVANVGGRAGGAITAAKFLQRFAAKFSWAHLDIAGSAWKSGPNKGATGRPVPLLLTYLTTLAKSKQVK
ncbi:MAG: leucyl aminopeptidase [Burkholderiaceae bacterium]|nr:leucyl aminopeptidase [Burkholderiaceae bacterium]